MQLYEVPNVLSAAQCAELIALGAPHLQRSPLGYAGHARPGRSSYSAKLPSIGAVGLELEARICGLVGLPSSHREPWEITRYRPGEAFGLHFDAAAGPSALRRFTAIACLQAPEAGGQTAFPRIGRSIAPQAGKLLWWPNLDAADRPMPEALHEGRPVLAGEKWILATWIGARPYLPPPAG